MGRHNVAENENGGGGRQGRQRVKSMLHDAEQVITIPGASSGQIRQAVDADPRDDREVRRDVLHDIVDALERSAGLDDGEVRVTSRRDGTVIVSGALSSWDGHDRAIAAVWSVPGVTAVADHIQVLA